MPKKRVFGGRLFRQSRKRQAERLARRATMYRRGIAWNDRSPAAKKAQALVESRAHHGVMIEWPDYWLAVLAGELPA